MATQSGIGKDDFFKLLSILYKVDAGSYTEDAGGKRSLDELFSFHPKEGTMSFSPEFHERFKKLEQKCLPQKALTFQGKNIDLG